MMAAAAVLSLTGMIYPTLKTTSRLDSKGTNFHSWRRELQYVFVDNGVDYVLDAPMPDKESDPEAHQKFLDDDMTARHIILGSLHDNLFLPYIHHETAKSLLDALTSLFKKPSMAKSMLLLKRYVGHKMGEGGAKGSANMHVLKMSNMAFDLRVEGVEVPEELRAVVLMNSLPDSWADTVMSVRMNMDGNEEKMKLSNVEGSVRRIGAALYIGL